MASIRAEISRAYRWRPGFFALVALVFGVWFLYDGFYTWPREQQIYATHEQYKSQGRLNEWTDLAREKGWPADEENPGRRHSAIDLVVQKGLAFVLLAVGAIFLVAWVRTFGRWIALDDAQLTTSWGAAAPLDAVRAMNLDRWKTKGIAVVQFDRNGRTGRIILDDWKYNRAATEQIVAALRAHLNMPAE